MKYAGQILYEAYAVRCEEAYGNTDDPGWKDLSREEKDIWIGSDLRLLHVMDERRSWKYKLKELC